MIDLFVADIDGCLTQPFETPDWDLISRIRALNQASKTDPTVPPLTLCTGRPLPYAESVAQWLGVRHPIVFESAGLFHWQSNRISSGLNSIGDPRRITDGTAAPIDMREVYGSSHIDSILAMKAWLVESLIPAHPGTVLEFTKLMDAGIVSPDTEAIRVMHREILAHVAERHPDLEVHSTDISVNILIRGNNKEMGLRLLGRSIGVQLDRIAYIGDSSGDIPALRIAGAGFCPSNATDAVKSVPGVHALPFQTTAAVVEAYEEVVRWNRTAAGGASSHDAARRDEQGRREQDPLEQGRQMNGNQKADAS